MWISEVKVHNFRPFYGLQSINFKDDSQEKFTIIEAKSDTGKTTFLSALSWCLYGKDLGDTNKRSNHPFNLERKDELRDGDFDTLEVEISINNDGEINPKYVIGRKARCVKLGNNIEYDGDILLRVEEWQDNEANPIKDPIFCQKVINSILPEDIHMFFLFEGEKLEKIFSFYNQENIQAAIEKVSQIQQVKSAIKHIEDARDKIYNDKTKGKGDIDIERNQKDIESLQAQIEGIEEKKKIYITVLNDAEKKITDIDAQLSSVNIPLITEWVSKRSNLEKNNTELEGKRKLIQEEVTESLLKNVPIAISSKALNNLLNIIKSTSQKNELPPKIKNIYIRELLEKKMCICGRTLDSQDTEAKNSIEILNKFLNQNDFSDLAEILIEGRFAIDDALRSLADELIKWRQTKLKEIVGIRNDIKTNLANIEAINDNLKNNNVESITKLNNERIILTKTKETQIRSIARQESEINNFKDEIVRKRKSNDDLAKKLKDYNNMKKIADFMDRAHIHLTKINDEILKEVRGKVETKTFESFINLHWDKENYKKFVIDDEYNMSLKDSKNNEKIFDIASGTKQVLLLSFIAALAEISGFKFPIFIDTPLANTDNEQRMNIASNLPNYLRGNQVILLVKDQEYTPQFRSIISNRMSQELRLVKTGGRTEVRAWA